MVQNLLPGGLHIVFTLTFFCDGLRVGWSFVMTYAQAT